MIKGVKSKYWQLNLIGYMRLFYWSFYPPRLKNILLQKPLSINLAVAFLVINYILGFFIGTVSRVITFKQAGLIFLGISQVIFLLPAMLALIFILSLVLHILAILLKGMGSYTQTLQAVALSSGPLAAIEVNVLRPFAYVAMVVLLVVNFFIFINIPESVR